MTHLAPGFARRKPVGRRISENLADTVSIPNRWLTSDAVVAIFRAMADIPFLQYFGNSSRSSSSLQVVIHGMVAG